MNYLNKEHEKRFNYLITKDNTGNYDKERHCLFYLLAGNRDLYEKRRFVYNLKEHCIIANQGKGGREVDFSSSAKTLVRLGFNLYNGMNQKDNSVCDIFKNLDEENTSLHGMRFIYDLCKEEL